MKISTILTVYILLGLVLMPDLCMGSAIKGINLCLSVVVPSLFPFFICSKILVKNGFAKRVSKPLNFFMRPVFNVPGCGAFAFVMGLLSGCPVGAKTVTDMYYDKMCTKAEAQRMLCFCNNSGPLFIMGSVAIGMLGFKEIGGILYISHVISAVIIGIVMGFYKRRESIKSFPVKVEKKETDIFSKSVSESVALTGYVCGFVVFFAVAVELLKQSGVVDIITYGIKNKNLIAGLLYGMCEMTNGISLLSGLRITPPLLSAISFVVGFGGLSIIMQVYGIIKKYNFSIAIFCFAKFFQGLISSFITYVLVSYSNISLPVFAEETKFGIFNHWAFFINIFTVFGIIIFFLSILYIICKILRRM